MTEYVWRTGRKCVFKNFAHLVFVTKYRRNVINKKMLKRMNFLIDETCKQMDCELIEFSGEDDHIHIMINIHPKLAVSNLVGKLKGKTSYFMRKEYWNHIKTFLWRSHFWSPSYCIVSCGGAPLEIIKQYIENQRIPTEKKHVKKSKALTQR